MTLLKTVQNTPAIKARDLIPAEKRRGQWGKTILGGLIAGVGLVAPKYLDFPWQFGAVVVGFGGFVASQQLVGAYLKAIPQALAAYVRALGGKNGE